MKMILDNIKQKLSDWLTSADSKRLVSTVVTAVIVTAGTFNGWLTEDQAQNIAGLVIAAILGDSYRPMNPAKVGG
jgi:TRAP-type C4-dicarboxylate transport system permease large subunit